MWVLSQARFFIDPRKMPESTLTMEAQWDCRVNINQQEQWLIDPLLPYSPLHHHVLLPCPTSPLTAVSFDFRPSIFSANVSKQAPDPLDLDCGSNIALKCISDNIYTSHHSEQTSSFSFDFQSTLRQHFYTQTLNFWNLFSRHKKYNLTLLVWTGNPLPCPY